MPASGNYGSLCEFLGIQMDSTALMVLSEVICSVILSSVTFERGIPFHLRCRASALVFPSVYLTPADATRETPPADPSDIKLTFQQHAVRKTSSIDLISSDLN